MIKNQKGTMAAAITVFTILCAAVTSPMQVQTAYAEDVQLPSETNTSFSKAREIDSGVSVAGTFPETGGKRYYKFSLEEAGKIFMELERSSGSGYIYLKFYDESQTEIYTYAGGRSAFTLSDLYLTGGTYYLAVEYDENLTFSFVANIDPMGESFTETQDSNNDMFSDASVINLKQKYKGILAKNDDIDYYKFQTAAAGLITLNLTNSTSNTMKYAVYDSSMNPVYTNTLESGSKVSQPVSVKSGDYYFVVTKEDVNKGTGSYTFSVDYVKKNTAAPKLKSVKNTSYATMTVKWSRVNGATGYELCYSTKANLKGSVTKKELDASASSAECYGLTQKKKYYVRIRAYSEINGIKEYGKWSNRKSVVIKK